MWADHYEKYRGTPKFGMSEQDKLEAQARLEGLKNAYLMNALSAKLDTQKDIATQKTGTARDIAGARVGGTIGDGGLVTPAAPEEMAPTTVANVAKNTTQAEVNTARAGQLNLATSVLKNAVGDGAPSADGTPAAPKMVVSGVRAGGVTAVNPAWTGDKAIIQQEAKNYGVQNTKTNSALHGAALLDSAYDPKSDTYNLSQLPAEELSNVATTVISNSQKGDAKTREQMRIRSLSGDAAGALSWALGKPINAVSGDNARMLEDIMFRQGSVSSGLKKTSAESVGAQDMGVDFDTEAAKLPVYQAYKARKAKEKIAGLTGATQTAVGARQKFNSLAELQAANLPKGTPVQIGNQTGTWGE